ncbi:hypothetical protein PR048_002873 [Dryococelus australis]|uniref:Uncharacterized protein n=1 Tax=Dryococelus australis TaxID=614101 RepID=A0ABQ9ILF7_9NEOP|nr:hypothetical protein PR048_002873 [Dryococelus australis]
MMWSEVRNMPLQYRQAKEALATLVEHLPEGAITSARYLYIRASKMSAVIPSVVNRTSTIPWRRPRKMLADPNLSSDLRAAAFGFYNNIVATQQRKYSIHLTADPACPLCGNTDTALYRIIVCVYAAPIWQWRRVRIRKIIRDEHGDVSDTHMLHCDFFTFPSVRRRAAAWFVLHAIGFLVDHSTPVTVQDFVQLFRQDRLNMARRAHCVSVASAVNSSFTRQQNGHTGQQLVETPVADQRLNFVGQEIEENRRWGGGWLSSAEKGVGPTARERAELSSDKETMEFAWSEYWDMEMALGAPGGQAPCILHAYNMRKSVLLWEDQTSNTCYDVSTFCMLMMYAVLNVE